MNALYADESGKIVDYFSGVDDLRAGRVRFVGDPKTGIRDYLRSAAVPLSRLVRQRRNR
jgi:poly(A) polymerase